jgi:hypothetical protein
MADTFREAELLMYWRTLSNARQTLRNNPSADISEQQTELDGIVINTDWPRLRDAATTASLGLMPPLKLDFDVIPAKASTAEDGNAMVSS